MNSGIFIIQEGGQLLELKEQSYLLENKLQQLLADYPNLIPGDQINTINPRRWLFMAREASLPAIEGGPWLRRVDHLFLDQDAFPTLIEVKLSTNPGIQGDVIVQLLGYAANAVATWSADNLRNFYATTHSAAGEQKLADFLGGEIAPEDFWKKAETNLRAGKIRLIFVVDKLPEELRRIIEFLNFQMNPAEVFAVEIRQFAKDDLRTLVPRLIGQTAQTQQRKSSGSSSKQWDEDSYFQELTKRTTSPASVAAAHAILDWAKAKGMPIWWGTYSTQGAFGPQFDWQGTSHWLAIVSKTGRIDLPFNQMIGKIPFSNEALRSELLGKLNQIPGINLAHDDIVKRPSIRLANLESSEALKLFLGTYDWYIERIKQG